MSVRSSPAKSIDSGISLLRVVSAFAVILLHAAAGIAGDVHHGYNREWWLANLLDAACRFCVPVFLMLSGALLLGYREPDGPFLKRRLRRILIPLVFWTLIYLLQGFLKAPQYVLEHLQEFLKNSWNALMNGVAYHLWYVYMLVGLYLFLPVLNAWVKQATQKQIGVFLLVWLVFVLGTQPWFDVLVPDIEVHYFIGYGSYLVLGYYLYRYRRVLHRQRWIPWLLYGLAVVITAYGTWRVNIGREAFSELFYDYRSPGVILMSASVFLIGLQFSGKVLPRWMRAADSASFGIYLVHILLMEYVWKISNDVTESGIGRVVLTALLTFIFSFIAIVLLRKIRPLKNLVG